MDQIGVRELRQNLSVYLRRVAAGEALEVTEHGRPVAVLRPLDERADAVERLVTAGRLRRPSRRVAKVPRPIGPLSHGGTEALEAEREERS